MLTAEGRKRAGELLAADLDGGKVVVSDGNGNTAERPIEDEILVATEGDVARVTLQVSFGEQEANFEWKQRRIVTKDGLVLDELAEDQGRKVAGAVWDVIAELDLAAAA